MSATSADYRMLDSAGVVELVAALAPVRQRLGGEPADWQVREVGDGNLNLVFIVRGAAGSACVKQAVPYVRVAGPSWPMSLERAFFESCYYRAVAPHVGTLIPDIYHYEPSLYCTVMEHLRPHVILRQGLIEGRRFPRLAGDLGEYLARTAFFTSDLSERFEAKLDGMARFAGNHALMRISVDLIFTDPYHAAERNRHTSPQLDSMAAQFRRDAPLKMAAARFGYKFLTEQQALLHGDLHSGSVMVTEDDTRVIDPEFAFYGPIGFDLGAFFGNLLLSWYSQPGHARAGDDRRAYQTWLLEQIVGFWQSFRVRFLSLWSEHPRGDAFPNALFGGPENAPAAQAVRAAFVDTLFMDMLGFGACKMIRRLLGFAHVLDFERISDPEVRGRCEAAALAMAYRLLTQPERFTRIEQVLESMTAETISPGL
jgi:5-methylthioribose kinase